MEAVSLQKEATRRRGLAEAHRRGVLARKGYLAWRDNTPRVDTIVTLFKVADTMRRLSLLKFAYFKMKLAADITRAGKALGLTHFRGNQLKHCWRRWRETKERPTGLRSKGRKFARRENAQRAYVSKAEDLYRRANMQRNINL